MFSSKKFKVCVLLIVMLIGLCIPVVARAKSTHAVMVKYDSRMERISVNTYVEKQVDPHQRDQIAERLRASRESVAGLFGSKEASPVLIFVQSAEGQRRYAENPTGQTYYLYWGNYIVLGPQGMDSAVISHELVHAELRERLLNKAKVPAWFDEGLATMVDGRYTDYDTVWRKETNGGERKIDLESMESSAAFAYGTAEAYTHYNLACYEVTRWYSRVGRQGLLQFIDDLNSGQPFASAYADIETSLERQPSAF
ncbi:hypothetical protein [Paenibacillus tepidiphilus]|uniref:hypothetical protein n=1 Tax=Paenibacillus tepidiphilus TaxID=2608683 RepID=UPI00123A74D2|nr:hypothetical protein [Paenibacillus tepidiphilus]